MGPLVGRTNDAVAEIAYLSSGAHMAWTGLPTARFMAVVQGTMTCRGSDGASRSVREGYGAIWEAHEDGHVESLSELTAVVIDGEFEVWAVAVTKKIEVTPYDPTWPQRYDELCGVLWPEVHDVALRIDHVGSTSVPGLAAKPVIDLDVVVASSAQFGPAIARLEKIGYRWKGDLGVPGREAFSLSQHSDLPAHHLYLVVDGSRPHLDHVLLRDFLRRDSDERDRYGELKMQNAREARDDMDVYVAAKAHYVAGVLTRARAEAGLPPVEYWDPETPVPS